VGARARLASLCTFDLICCNSIRNWSFRRSLDRRARRLPDRARRQGPLQRRPRACIEAWGQEGDGHPVRQQQPLPDPG